MNRVLEHLAQDSEIDIDEDDESGSELSNNYQSDNDDRCRLVILIVCVNRLNERK